MKTVHVPFCFAPDPMGGTEVYVAALARNLQEMGFESLIAAPGTTTNSYTADGLCVHRFEVSPETDLRQLYGEGDPHAAAGFERILDEEKPDLVHLHAFTQGVSVLLARAAKPQPGQSARSRRRRGAVSAMQISTAACGRRCA
jgi:hypothetical protein